MNMVEDNDERRRKNSHRAYSIAAGLFVIAVGLVFLADRMGVDFPAWFFTWPMLMIAFGVFIGIKHRFRAGGWPILVLLGIIFLFDRIYNDRIDLLPFLLPAVLILVGLGIALRPWRNKEYEHLRQCGHSRDRRTSARRERKEMEANEDFLRAVSIFGGSQKNIFSKKFKGGEVTAIFGGNDLNLSQADFEGTIVMEVVNIFGGTTIMIPSNWQIKDEMVNIFGGTDDKRIPPSASDQPTRVLVISGVSVFGGVEIKSF